jgi:hypothetical protein
MGIGHFDVLTPLIMLRDTNIPFAEQRYGNGLATR